MADRRGREKTSLVLDGLLARLANNRAFADAFRCPRHDGAPVPCMPDRMTRVPGVPAPFGAIDCPIMAVEGCEPFTTYLAFRAEEERRAQRIESERCGLEGRLADVRFETVESTPAVKAVRAWLADGFHAGRALILTGDTGLGKTWAAACAINSTTVPRHFWLFSGLCSLLMTPTKRDEAAEIAAHVPFAVFDEFGAEYTRPGTFLDAQVDALIWTRENRRLPTIFTTNLSATEMRAHFSPRAMDRLIGWSTAINITGKSMRKET